jgi:hypothetical protein
MRKPTIMSIHTHQQHAIQLHNINLTAIAIPIQIATPAMMTSPQSSHHHDPCIDINPTYSPTSKPAKQQPHNQMIPTTVNPPSLPLTAKAVTNQAKQHAQLQQKSQAQFRNLPQPWQEALVPCKAQQERTR